MIVCCLIVCIGDDESYCVNRQHNYIFQVVSSFCCFLNTAQQFGELQNFGGWLWNVLFLCYF